MVPLFTEKPRTDPTPRAELEPTFDFLDRVSTPYFQEVRVALNRWVDDYAADEREEMVSRLRGASGSFRDAFWELWLYTAYRGAGFEVEIHPEIPDSEKRPDFLVSRGEFAAFLEARVATGSSAQSVARENLLGGLYAAFNTESHPDFRLWISILKEGTGQPSARGLRREVMRWLDALDVEAVARQGPPFPEHVERVRDWAFRFQALPLDREKRGMSTAPMLAVTPGGSFAGDAGAAFRKALQRKGRRYGPGADPLILAIQVEAPWTHDEDIESALYGRTSQRIEQGPHGLVHGQVRRLEDGYWTATDGRRVAGVLTARNVRPWSVLAPRPRLWADPFRANALRHPEIWHRGHLEVDRSRTRWDPPAELVDGSWFGVGTDWPPGETFPA